jgi:hypothetical protein
MTARLALLLLAAWLALRLYGQWRRLKAEPRGRPRVESARKCPDCGAYVVGSSPGPCARADCRFR